MAGLERECEDLKTAGAADGGVGRPGQALFDMRLTPLARMAGAANLEEYVGILRSARRPQMHRAIADAMTIHETSFFRDREAFEMLRETVVPRLIARRSKERRLRVWCAACSTGQEAHSVAMLLCEHFPELEGWDVKVLGTDVSCEVVDLARVGKYRRMDVNRGLPARMLMEYMERDGEMWKVSARLRGMCDFAEVNLCVALPELAEFDLVLLRNVLLYLPLVERCRVFEQVRGAMAGDGYLLLGSAEQAEDSTQLFELESASGCYVYRPASGG